VSTMKTFKLRRLAFAGALLALVGCGGQSDTDTADSAAAAGADSLTLDKQLEVQMNAVFDRLRYDDKSGLWENEFEYLREERTFDDYVTQPYIANASADSLVRIEVTSVERLGDSAVARVLVHFDNAGRKSVIDDKVTLYWHQGKWIKPTISRLKDQAAFDSVRNAAIEAAKKESGN